MQKITTRWLNENAVKCDQWSFKDGVYKGCKSYYWAPRISVEEFSTKVIDQIKHFIGDTHTITLVDSGNVWKPFRGGATVANQSHYWVKLTIKPIENQCE